MHIKQKVVVTFIKERQTIKILHLFRNYSAFAVVVSSAFLVSATNLAAGRESSGFLFGYFGENENYENPLKDTMFLKTAGKTSATIAGLSKAKTLPDPKNARLEKEDEALIIQGQALVAGNSPIKKDPREDGGVVIYEVKQGDTVGAIAAANHISINTILWSNELDNVDSIKPGDKSLFYQYLVLIIKSKAEKHLIISLLNIKRIKIRLSLSIICRPTGT